MAINYDKANRYLTIEMISGRWLAIHGYLCLALRHPQATGPTRQIALDLVQDLEAAFLAQGLLDQEDVDLIHKVEQDAQETLKMGWKKL